LPAHLLRQIQPDDAFGQQMLLNLESRGCALLGIEGGAGWRQ
jgi:tRNA wybutosine-synthesizing protein 4